MLLFPLFSLLLHLVIGLVCSLLFGTLVVGSFTLRLLRSLRVLVVLVCVRSCVSHMPRHLGPQHVLSFVLVSFHRIVDGHDSTLVGVWPVNRNTIGAVVQHWA